jgi:hypothetical protein
MELAWLVQEAGYAVLGPERSVAEACKVLGRIKVDLALLAPIQGHRNATEPCRHF